MRKAHGDEPSQSGFLNDEGRVSKVLRGANPVDSRVTHELTVSDASQHASSFYDN